MRNFCRGLLLGILLSSCIPLVSMEQALEEMESESSKKNDSTPPPAAKPDTPPPAAKPDTPPPAAKPDTPPPAAKPDTPPPAAKPDTPPPAVKPDTPPPAAKPDTLHHKITNEPHHVEPPHVEPKKIAPKATLQVVDVESSGLDTINIDSGGNWLEKRIWFKKSEALFDDILKLVGQAADMRMDFVDAVNAVGKKIDNFYDVVSYDKGQIEELLKNVSRSLSDASAQRGGDLSDKERQLHLTIQTEQKQIEQVRDDIKKVEEIDEQIEKTMGQAFKTIDACRALESKAWSSFKEIGSELDDKKARTLYYEMENAQKNIEQNIHYLKNTLLPYLQNKLVASADKIMATILSSVKILESKGINLKSLLNEDEQKDLIVEEEREAAKEKKVEEDWEKKKRVKELEEEKQKNLEESAKKSFEKKEEDQNAAWYTKFFVSMSKRLQYLGCFLFNEIRAISCKALKLAPDFFESIFQGLKLFWEYIVAFFSMLFCYFKCMVCSIKSWLCELFGK